MSMETPLTLSSAKDDASTVGSDSGVSWNQRALIFLHFNQPDSPAYNMSLALKLDASFDVDSMVDVFKAAVRAHPPLRTGYQLDGSTVGAIEFGEDAAELIIETAPDDTACKSRLDELSLKPFDLTEGRVARLAIISNPNGERFGLVTIHHIAGDHYSFEQLLEELTAAWQGRPAFADIDHDYQRWVRDEAAYIGSAKGKKDLDLWRDLLASNSNRLKLPTDASASANQSFEGGFVKDVWDSRLNSKLRDLAKANRVTRYIALMAAFQLYIGALGGQQKFLLGTPSAGRFTRADRSVIGYCANPLLAPVDISAASTFEAHIAETQSRMRSVFALQRLPMAYVLDQALSARDPSDMALAPCFFTFIQERRREFASDYGYELLWSQQRGAAHALNLLIYASGDDLEALWRYDTALFKPETVDRFALDFRVFVETLCDAPNAPIAEVMAKAWHKNGDAAKVLSAETALDRIERQSNSQTAIQAGPAALSYFELLASGKGLAGVLEERGISRGDRIALVVEDDIQRVISMLACWYVGAAYIALDPADPIARLEQLVGLAGAKLIVSDLDYPNSGHVISTLEQAPLKGGSRPSAEDIAYIIFTSGTTGTPKPVAVPHRALISYVDGLMARFAPVHGSSFASLAGPAADLGYTSLFGALLSGGVVRLLPHEAKLDPALLSAHLERYPVDYLKITPSHFGALLASETRILPEKALIFGGEKPTPELIGRVKMLSPDLRVFNHYGPTETTVGVACDEVFPNEASGIQLDGVIGRALDGAGLHVLDARLAQVPTGAIGELYVSGDQLAHGYLGASAQTADRFVPNPYGSGDRLYRTGDRVRRLADDGIQYLGRSDDQVKIRGFRIELGEIERTLASLDGIKQCAVIAIGDSTKQLAACVVGAVEQADLASGLAKRLPVSMQPHHWVHLETLPRLSNGKIDRKSLTKTAIESIGSGDVKTDETSVSGSSVFLRMVQIWRDVLNTSDLTPEDNFFALGGDSILSLQVVARAKKAGISLKPKDLFIHQTLGDLARFAAAQSSTTSGERSAAKRLDSYPLTPIQQWFFDTQSDAPAHWNQSLLLALPGKLETSVFHEAVAGGLQRHPILTGAFEESGGRWQLVPGAISDINKIAPIEACADLEAIKSKCRELERSFDLSEGGLIRVALLTNAASDQTYLFATAHHLVIDAMSWRTLLPDLALRLGGGAPEPVTDWVGLELAQSAVTDSELASAKEYLEGLVAHATDFQFGNVSNSVTARFILNADATAAVISDAVVRLKLDPQDIMVAALNRAWRQVMDEANLIVELEGHGRTADTTELLGWFTHRYPVFFEIDKGSPEALLVGTANTLRNVPELAKRAVALRFGDPDLPSVIAPISLNYLGETGEISSAIPGITRIDWPINEMRSTDAHRLHGLDITIELRQEELHILFDADPGYIPLAKAQSLLYTFKDALVEIAGIDSRGRLLSEVTAGGISPEALSDLENRLGPNLEDVWPLTPVQSGMLLEARLSGRGALYTNVAMFAIGGIETAEDLILPWSQLIARHAALRAQAFEADGEHWLAVLNAAEPNIDVRDLSHLDQMRRDEEIGAIYAAEKQRRFNLANAPLMHITLCRLSPDDWRLIWTRHHLVSDGWTSALLAFEALTLASGGTLAPVPPHSEYFKWADAQDIAAQRAYWKTHAETSEFEGQLPGLRYAVEPITFDELIAEDLQEKLELTTKRYGISLSTLLHAAWALALADTIGTTSPLFATVNAGRPPEIDGIDRVAGAFIQTLPAALQVSLTDNIESVLRAFHGQLAEGRENGLVPLAELASEFGRSGGRPFDTLLVVENYPMEAAGLEFGKLNASLLMADEKSDFPLTVQILPGERLRVLARTNGQVDKVVCETLLARFNDALGFLVADQQKAIAAYFDKDSETTLDVVEGARSNKPWFASPEFITSLRERPEAVVFQSQTGLETVSGEDLLNDARAIARAVIELVPDRNGRVAVALERCDWLAKTLLGLHLAGVCYVPIDLSQPGARREKVLKQASCVALIGVGGDAPDALAERGRELLLDDSNWEPKLPHLDELAYIIFTSGTTGEPKGVGVTYRAVSHLLDAFSSALPEAVGSRWLAMTPLSFDIAYLELFMPLCHKGTLLLAPRELATDGHAILDFIHRTNPKIIQATPSSWSIIAGALTNQPDSLNERLLISGGEALSGALANTLRKYGKSLSNVYGPTETCVWSSITKLAEALEEEAIAPLGLPLDGEKLYVLDAFVRPVQPGMAGDLWISGEGLARGYIGEPGLTADAFAPNPFGASGTRMYRTGDRVILGDLGKITYLGRSNGQIKLRGHRIEIGEVEAALASAPGVAAGAVKHTDPNTFRARLVAYAVPTETAIDDELAWRSDIARHLGARLVDAAIPAQIIRLDEMPLTVSGKINRKALPAPFIEQAGGAPHTDREIWLAAAWAELLDIADLNIIGRETRFFELGANSIGAARLVARVKADLGIDLPLIAIFQESALHKMAAELDKAPGAQSDEDLAFMAELLEDLD